MITMKLTITPKDNNHTESVPTANLRTKGKSRAAIKAPSDTKRVERNTIKKISIEIAAARGKIPITTPRDVATPLPPLNPANRGNKCPVTAKKAQPIRTLISNSSGT